MANITDGISNTYLIGERHINPDYYATGTDADDDQGWMIGYDTDVIRETNPISDCVPRQDTPGESHYWAFGGAHAGSFNMVFCDGSVHSDGLLDRLERSTVALAIARTVSPSTAASSERCTDICSPKATAGGRGFVV